MELFIEMQGVREQIADYPLFNVHGHAGFTCLSRVNCHWCDSIFPKTQTQCRRELQLQTYHVQESPSVASRPHHPLQRQT